VNRPAPEAGAGSREDEEVNLAQETIDESGLRFETLALVMTLSEN